MDPLAENEINQDNTVTETIARDRRGNSKALKTLGVDSSAEKQRRMLGIDGEEYERARTEVSELSAPLAGGHSIEIPLEQLRAQVMRRRVRRVDRESHSERDYLTPSSTSNGDNVLLEDSTQGNRRGNFVVSDSLPRLDHLSDNEPRTGDEAILDVFDNQLDDDNDWFDDEEAGYDGFGRIRLRRDLPRDILERELNQNIEGEEPLQLSAPNRYFYYYYDGERDQPRRRRCGVSNDHTPMMDKRANKKAFTVLGINPSEEKLMEVLGLEERQQLDEAVSEASSPLSSDDLAVLPSPPLSSRHLQNKAFSTLGLTPLPSKTDFILGRFDENFDRPFLDSLSDLHLQAAFI